MAWSPPKAFAGAKYFKGRTAADLAEHIHAGMYAETLAIPGLSSVKGGNFVMDKFTNKCEVAERIFEHGFSNKVNGLQAVVDKDEILNGVFPEIWAVDPKNESDVAAVDRFDLRVASPVRAVIRWRVR